MDVVFRDGNATAVVVSNADRQDHVFRNVRKHHFRASHAQHIVEAACVRDDAAQVEVHAARNVNCHVGRVSVRHRAVVHVAVNDESVEGSAAVHSHHVVTDLSVRRGWREGIGQYVRSTERQQVIGRAIQWQTNPGDVFDRSAGRQRQVSIVRAVNSLWQIQEAAVTVGNDQSSRCFHVAVVSVCHRRIGHGAIDIAYSILDNDAVIQETILVVGQDRAAVHEDVAVRNCIQVVCCVEQAVRTCFFSRYHRERAASRCSRRVHGDEVHVAGRRAANLCVFQSSHHNRLDLDRCHAFCLAGIKTNRVVDRVGAWSQESRVERRVAVCSHRRKRTQICWGAIGGVQVTRTVRHAPNRSLSNRLTKQGTLLEQRVICQGKRCSRVANRTVQNGRWQSEASIVRRIDRQLCADGVRTAIIRYFVCLTVGKDDGVNTCLSRSTEHRSRVHRDGGTGYRSDTIGCTKNSVNLRKRNTRWASHREGTVGRRVGYRTSRSRVCHVDGKVRIGSAYSVLHVLEHGWFCERIAFAGKRPFATASVAQSNRPARRTRIQADRCRSSRADIPRYSRSHGSAADRQGVWSQATADEREVHLAVACCASASRSLHRERLTQFEYVFYINAASHTTAVVRQGVANGHKARTIRAGRVNASQSDRTWCACTSKS